MAKATDYTAYENYGGSYRYNGETSFNVTTVKEAWNMAREIFPCDYERDDGASEYPMYIGTKIYNNGLFCWISDLNDRLEVNLPDGTTVNIWIKQSDSSRYGSKISQNTYNALISLDEDNEMSDEDAKKAINKEFGFEVDKIHILHIVQDIEAGEIRKKYARVPLYGVGFMGKELLYASFEVCEQYYEAYRRYAVDTIQLHHIKEI